MVKYNDRGNPHDSALEQPSTGRLLLRTRSVGICVTQPLAADIRIEGDVDGGAVCGQAVHRGGLGSA
jgi:hypothetical protein